MAATLEKREVMLQVGHLLDQCRECTKNTQTREIKVMESICGGCPVYDEILICRKKLDGGRVKKKRRVVTNNPLRHLTPELYRQYKKDKLSDESVAEKYGVDRKSIIKWKKKRFTEEELIQLRTKPGRKHK